MRPRAPEHEPADRALARAGRQKVGNERHAGAARRDRRGLGVHHVVGFAGVAEAFDPFDDAGTEPLQAGIAQRGIGVELRRRAVLVVGGRKLRLLRAHHENFPRSRRKHGLIFFSAGAEDRELRVVPGGNHGNAFERGKPHFFRRGARDGADDAPRVGRGREQLFFQPDGGENFVGKFARPQIRHLRRSRHRAVGRHDAREAVRQEVRNEEPGGGPVEKLGPVFLEPNEFVNGVEGERADAGNAVQLILRNVFPDVFHDGRRTRAFPGNDGIEQLSPRVDERAVHAESRHGHGLDAGNVRSRERLARAF